MLRIYNPEIVMDKGLFIVIRRRLLLLEIQWGAWLVNDLEQVVWSIQSMLGITRASVLLTAR